MLETRIDAHLPVRTRSRSRRRRLALRIPRRVLVLAGAALGGCAVVAGIALAPERADPSRARAELVQSLGLLSVGNFNGAQAAAVRATRDDPSWGLAEAVLARAELARGEGIAAEGALNRAVAHGFPADRLHQLFAHAYLLEGNTTRALAEAARANPAFGGYAMRVAARAYQQQGDFASAQAIMEQLLAAAPQDSLAWSDMGRLRLQMGDMGGAIDAATRATTLDRNNIEALTLRGELVRGQYGLVAALPWFEAALAHDAYYHPALIEYAATLGDAGRSVDMLAATRRALATRPGSPQAYYLQAVLAARAGNWDLAQQLLNRTRGQLSVVPGALLLQGVVAYQNGAEEQAIQVWRMLVGRQPMNITARRLLGTALLRGGDPRGALDVLRPLAMRSDTDSYSLGLIARALEANGQRGGAAQFLDRASVPARAGAAPFGSDDPLAQVHQNAQLAPTEPVARLQFVRGLLEGGDTAGAAVQAQDITRLMPGSPAAWLALGDTLVAGNRSADAIQAYRHAADLRFDEPTLLRLIDVQERSGQHVDAAAVLTLFLSQNPQNVTAQRLAAHWQVAAGEWGAAINTLEELRERLGDRDAALLAELSYAYSGNEDDATAVRYGRAAYALAPMNPVAADAYGWALYQQGHVGAGAQLLYKAVSLAPAHSTLRWHLAQALADGGRRDAAVAQIRAALADPRFAERDAATALLRALG